MASFRSGIAALTLFLFLPSSRRGLSWRSGMVGSAYAITMILFVTSNKLTTAANSVFLQSTYPFYVLLLSPLLLKESIRRRDLGFMAVIAVGFVLFFIGVEPPVATAPDPVRGNVLAATSGITWALTLIGLRWMSGILGPEGGTAAAAVGMGNVVAFLVVLPKALPVAGTGTDWLIVGYLGVFQIGIAYILLLAAVRHLSAIEVAIMLMIEPVINPIWAWMLHGERPGPGALVGGAIIVVATLLKTVVDARAKAPNQKAAA